jgi:DNA-binding IclR family transcriptional regulator
VNSHVQVLGKAASLLDALAERHELTVAELAELTREPRSTVYRLLASLQHLDMIERGSERGTYRLGLQLFRLGAAVTARFDERQAALPVMERIHEQTGETVFLCIRRGLEAVCIERIDGRRVQSLALRLGGSLPLHAGAAPRALLAHEPRAFWETYVSNGTLQALTPKTPATRERLFPTLHEVRKKGYSVSDEDVTIGIAAVGAPIFGHQGRVRAALSISGVRPAILARNRRAMIACMVDGARDVSHALGFREPPRSSADA